MIFSNRDGIVSIVWFGFGGIFFIVHCTSYSKLLRQRYSILVCFLKHTFTQPGVQEAWSFRHILMICFSVWGWGNFLVQGSTTPHIWWKIMLSQKMVSVEDVSQIPFSLSLQSSHSSNIFHLFEVLFSFLSFLPKHNWVFPPITYALLTMSLINHFVGMEE